MITLAQYFMGRDKTYAAELTDEMRANAAVTVERTNLLLAAMLDDGLDVDPPVTSGWRPTAINRRTPGAAPKSGHLICTSVDLGDGQGILDDWCMANLDVLKEIGLWLEHPDDTPGWCHLQTRPPRSGRRVFRA